MGYKYKGYEVSAAYSKEDDCIAHHNAENEENQTISRHQGNDEDKKIGVLNQRIKKRQKSSNRLNNQYKKLNKKLPTIKTKTT